MRFLGTDFSRKYVIAEVDGQEILVSFYDTQWKGIHDISFSINGIPVPTKIKSTYPGFLRKIREAAFLIRLHLEYAVNSISERNR